MEEPVFEPDCDDVLLLCPKCKKSYLHQGTVRIYAREHEDGDGTVIVVSGPRDFHATKATDEELRTVAGRRQALTIEFRCENCNRVEGPAFQLRIKQHKGRTRVSWVNS